ncbi:serine-rich coiled-coil domain-containing protein 2 isoform 2-T2 [Pholidichthys leucotaenia]
MEKKVPIKSAMVSRLPKFGGRTSATGTSSLFNGSTQPTTPPQDGKTTSADIRPNGLTHASPLSLKWKIDERIISSSPTTLSRSEDGCEDRSPTQLPSLVKNGSPATPKMRRSGSLLAAVSSPKANPRQSTKMSPCVGAKLGQSPINGGSKLCLNGSSIPTQTASDLRLVRPRLGSTSTRSSSQDSLSQSNEGLKILAVDNIVRSNSFTHFKQIPSPKSEPMIRSFSFNRAVELAKPLANTQLQPPRSSFFKPPQLSSGKVGLGLNGSLGASSGPGGGLGGLQYSKTPRSASSLSSSSIPSVPTTPRALKKPLLPGCVLSKSLASSGGSMGCRLTQSEQAKTQKPNSPARPEEDIRSSAASECGGLMGTAIDIEAVSETGKVDSHREKSLETELFKQNADQAAGETSEDMSLSSVSSLDRGDTSEEFLDDFDSVGDVFSDGDLPDNINSGSNAQTQLHSLLSETIDWDSEDLAGNKEKSPTPDSQGSQVLSPDGGDAPQVSSVEMSPSNSSGGTYMWDEEGLEPLGGIRTHPSDSFGDSDLNSMDVLNNLDPLGAGELDDDDLMLDVDLPEDGLHDTDMMSQIECLERANRQGPRRKHHRWSGPNHFHSNGRGHVFQHYDGIKSSKMSSRPSLSEDRQHGYVPTLDELTLEHMTQDCSFLKNHLLKLKTLLQLEDTDTSADVPEEAEDNTTASQLEVLIKEVQLLKEELRSRDKIIAQLTSRCQQLQQQQEHEREQTPAQGRQVKCQCHHQRALSSLRPGNRQMDKRVQHHYDKATQTYWRPPSHAGVLPTPFLSSWQAQQQGLTRTSMPQRRQTSNTAAFQPQSQRAPHPGKTSKNSPHRGPQ